MNPQFWLNPRIPKASVTREGKTPKRKPYPRPENPDTKLKRCGLLMTKAQAWENRNITDATKRHQMRLA